MSNENINEVVVSQDELSPAELARKYNELKAQSDELEQELKEIKKAMSQVEQQLIQGLEVAGLDLIRLDGYSFSVQEREVYSIKDWDAVSQYVLETGDVSILQKRLSSTVVRELEMMGQEPPGVEKYVRKTVSRRKA
jgi:predicted RNase H-like nuclease (RuvC/YqgF family)